MKVDERYYLAYVLGYDLLHDKIEASDFSECDTSFDKCLQIVDKFMESVEYEQDQSAYENLKEWLENNRNKVAMLFDEWVGSIDVLDDDELNELYEDAYWADGKAGESLRKKYNHPREIPWSVILAIYGDTQFTPDDFLADVDYWKE